MKATRTGIFYRRLKYCRNQPAKRTPPCLVWIRLFPSDVRESNLGERLHSTKVTDMKKTILNLLDNDHMEKFYVFLILLELVLCIYDSETKTFATFKTFFNYFEFFVIGVFTVEYVLRIFTIDKIRNIFKPLMMIDLLTILPVTGLLFVMALTFSSVFVCFAEQSTAHLALKKLPPSSLWSVVAFGIYSFDGSLPIASFVKFVTSIKPGLGIFTQGVTICILGALIFDTVMKKYNSYNLKKMTIRTESNFVDF